jgi:hypothetical protein
MNNIQIDKFCLRLRGYRGCSSFDRVPILRHGEWVIINSLAHDAADSIVHWYLAYNQFNRIYGFDSLAMSNTVWPYPMFYINKTACQSPKSQACGFHCLFFISFILQGIDHKIILSQLYSGNKGDNDKLARMFVKHINYKFA